MQRFGEVRFPEAREQPETDCGCTSNSSHAQCDCTSWGIGGTIFGLIVGALVFTAVGRESVSAASRVARERLSSVGRR